MKGLENKVALVTGSSRGIGRAIALRLAQEGCHVIVNYRSNTEAARTVVEEIEALGVEALAVQADVRLPEETQRMAAEILKQFEGIHILVNNAGITRDQLLLRMSNDDWDAVLNTNLKGAFNCIKAVQRSMLRQRWGRIIQIGSVIGLSGNAGQANYAAAKAGLVGLTKSVAREYGSRNITANLVAPGFIDTEMTAELPEETVEAALERIALQRLGQTADVAGMVAFLASDDGAYITGQVIALDGGLTM